mmetsp:Transcript_8949/g.16104  ORF Transcript_8949/g.16104 Transcript_8949/m.16104 type:complete len:309 (-) Transcript_8949:55-981(-)
MVEQEPVVEAAEQDANVAVATSGEKVEESRGEEAVSSTAPPQNAEGAHEAAEVSGASPAGDTAGEAIPELNAAAEETVPAADNGAQTGEAPAASVQDRDVPMVDEQPKEPEKEDEEERKAREKRKAEAEAAAEALAEKRAKWEEKRRELYDPMIAATQGLRPKDVFTSLEVFGLIPKGDQVVTGYKTSKSKLFILGACEKPGNQQSLEEHAMALERRVAEKPQNAALQETDEMAEADTTEANAGVSAEAMQAYYQQIGEPEDDGTSPFMQGGYAPVASQGYGPPIGQPGAAYKPQMIRPQNPFGKTIM